MPDFDPKKIKTIVKKREIIDLEPTEKRAAKDHGRMPIISRARELLKNSERGQTKAAQKNMRLAKVNANLETTLDGIEVEKNTSKGKLATSERELISEQVKTTALASDQEEEIAFLKEKRQLEREN